MKDRTVLVTGATGFIGRYVVSHLLDEGLRIFALVPEGEEYFPPENKAVEVVRGDITDRLHIPAGVSAIYHCAGVITMVEEMERVNVRGTQNVVEAAIANNCRLIHLSSAGVVGKTNNKTINEETPCRPDSLYEKTKLRAEEIVRHGINKGLRAQILRPTIVFGAGRAPGDDSFFQLISVIATNNYRHIRGGSGIYNIVNAGEVARAMFALDNDAIPSGSVFIINTPIRFFEFASIISGAVGKDNAKIGNIPYAAALTAAAIFSLLRLLTGKKRGLTYSRLKALTDSRTFSQDRLIHETTYRPLHSVAEYLKKVCEEYRITPN
ncbi:MAG: NAD-dependent epimerase/dehydratase family protein [Syntrophorhabdaceae bacterium]|nr:NAD-dependent epimerase/dehydratase family protein [Syntrophorhabdaceae bacterium]MDD5242377.1 NAD-dependent epimerase/dehydratase family protein [Syntrophorhabdaceae bacterium]